MWHCFHRSSGRVTKVSPRKSTSPKKSSPGKKEKNRQYDKPWMTGMQKKALKSEDQEKDALHKVEGKQPGFTRTMELRRAGKKTLGKYIVVNSLLCFNPLPQ